MALEDSRWIIHKGSGCNESLPSQNIHCRFTCGHFIASQEYRNITCFFQGGDHLLVADL